MVDVDLGLVLEVLLTGDVVATTGGAQDQDPHHLEEGKAVPTLADLIVVPPYLLSLIHI